MKKLFSIIFVVMFLMSPLVCLAEEKVPDTCPKVTVNGTEFKLGMSYADCVSILKETGMKRVDELHIPALRIGVEAYNLEVEGKWIEATATFYGPVEFRFVAAMPAGLGQKDTDGAVKALEENGKLCAIQYRLSELEEFNVTEFAIDDLIITETTSGEDMKAFADSHNYLSEENEQVFSCGMLDEDNNCASFMIRCQFEDEKQTTMKALECGMEEEYFMAMYY